MNSILFSTVVVHERFRPFENRFKYNVLSMFIDYDELYNLSKSDEPYIHWPNRGPIIRSQIEKILKLTRG